MDVFKDNEDGMVNFFTTPLKEDRLKFVFFNTKEAFFAQLPVFLKKSQPINLYHIGKQKLYETIQNIRGNPPQTDHDYVKPGFDFQGKGWLFNGTDNALFIVLIGHKRKEGKTNSPDITQKGG